MLFPFCKVTLWGGRVLDRPGEGTEAISSRNSCCIRSSGLQAARYTQNANTGDHLPTRGFALTSM